MKTFWSYVRFQSMMFVFGIVGPIFLIAYFAVQPDPTTRWMYWWGLFITALDVLVALSLTKAAQQETTSNDAVRRVSWKFTR